MVHNGFNEIDADVSLVLLVSPQSSSAGSIHRIVSPVMDVNVTKPPVTKKAAKKRGHVR
jgi:hypothetical protein